ncbi:TIGR02646 family protein [Pseudomonas sp. NPDC089406]|uniref:TIGR02646 family protein n=1 Tax=Pseudomonas sp. NPDC089406 TaxID=3364463 RepID=UPI00384F64F2
MRKIDKGAEPEVLTRFKAKNPGKHYNDLDHLVRAAIRQSCTIEQLYLCAYCCAEITGEQPGTMNEHLQCRDKNRPLSLAFDNIVASCTTPGQCDAAKGNHPLPVTPLMHECETELKFLISGRVKGLSAKAVQTIAVLNLGDHEDHNKQLVEKRRQLSHWLLQENGLDPNSPLEDDELLLSVIDDLNRPEQGRLKPFAPAVVSILKSWLSAAS